MENNISTNIMHRIYGAPHDFKRIDAFNAANQEIIEFLKQYGFQDPRKQVWNAYKRSLGRSNDLKPLYWKLFDYVVNRKLDSAEIQELDQDFNSPLAIGHLWAALKKSSVAPKIDSIYHKHGLNLPSFKAWKQSEFVGKGSSEVTKPKKDVHSEDFERIKSVGNLRDYIKTLINECFETHF